ncbi:MAG: hypothetical protein GY943_00200 [Chloroflexi bacterium]|nr:hypothetical protein [Chloroflexota bacterium]
MSNIPIIAIIIVLMLVLFLAFLIIVYRRKGEMPKTDYRLFFILGIIWLPMGIATDNSGLWVIGLVFLITGLANRDKWKDGKI